MLAVVTTRLISTVSRFIRKEQRIDADDAEPADARDALPVTGTGRLP